jgi:hypothetical protein
LGATRVYSDGVNASAVISADMGMMSNPSDANKPVDVPKINPAKPNAVAVLKNLLLNNYYPLQTIDYLFIMYWL